MTDKRDVIMQYEDDERELEQTWEDFLSDFPATRFHHMVDVQPIRANAPWVRLGYWDNVTDDEWYSGISAAEVLKKFSPYEMLGDVSQCWCSYPVYWHAERIPDKGKMKPWDEVVIVTIERSVLWAVRMSVLKIVHTVPELFNSRDLGFFKILCDRIQKPEEKPQVATEKSFQEEEKNGHVYVWLVTRHPVVSQVQAYVGDPKAVSSTEKMYDGKTYHLCDRPKSPTEPTSVPYVVACLWLQQTFKMDRAVNYLDPAYYKRDFVTYTSWSFGIHVKQVASVLAALPTMTTVVAPGDGVGVVSSLWRRSVTGDMMGTPSRTFLEVMEEGRRADSTSVLILSYVYSLFSELEKQVVASWPGPVYEIDCRSYPLVPGAVCIGPGVFVRNFYQEMYSPGLTAFTEDALRLKKTKGTIVPAPPEGVMVPQEQLYSENLLRLTSISYWKENPSVAYYRAMRPFSSVSQWQKGKTSEPPVIHNLQELVDFWLLEGEYIVYLASIGQFVERAQFVDISLLTRLSVRSVYCVRKDDERVSYLKKRCSWAPFKDFILITFSASAVIRFSGQGREVAYFRQEIVVSEGVDSVRSASILDRSPYGILFSTPFGLVRWTRKGQLSALLVDLYARLVCGDMKKYSDVLSADRVSLIPGVDNDEVYEILNAMKDQLEPDCMTNPLGWRMKGTGQTFLSQFYQGPDAKVLVAVNPPFFPQ